MNIQRAKELILGMAQTAMELVPDVSTEDAQEREEAVNLVDKTLGMPVNVAVVVTNGAITDIYSNSPIEVTVISHGEDIHEGVELEGFDDPVVLSPFDPIIDNDFLDKVIAQANS